MTRRPRALGGTIPCGSSKHGSTSRAECASCRQVDARGLTTPSHHWYRSLDRPQSSGWRTRKRTTLQAYDATLQAVQREAPELPDDVAQRVTIAVLRALALAAPRDVVCATAAPIAAVSSASAEVPMYPA